MSCDQFKALQERVHELERERADLQDKLLRTLAQVQNERRRSEQRIERAIEALRSEQ